MFTRELNNAMVLTLLSSATLLLLNREKPDTRSHISTWSTVIVTHIHRFTGTTTLLVLLSEMAFNI